MKNKAKKQGLKKIVRLHSIFTMIVLGLYLTLASVYGFAFIFSDMHDKFTALADSTLMITAKVLGAPVKPVVSGSAVCANGKLSIDLDWADDENSETFAIERDGATLVTGLVDSKYSDSVVSLNTTYNYVVTANGIMDPGQATSESISVITMEECKVPLPPPAVGVTAFNDKSIFSYKGVPTTTLRRPAFSGTTNIPNAVIKIELHSDLIITAQLSANAGGYWEWSPLVDIPTGAHQLSITAQDPLDVLREATTSFDFVVEKKSENEDKKHNDNKDSHSSYSNNGRNNNIGNKEQKNPFAFTLNLQNNSIFQGDDLLATMGIQNLRSEYFGTEANVEYRIFNNKGVKVFEYAKKIVLTKDAAIEQNIQVPKYLQDGQYKLQVNIASDKYNISQEKDFTVLPVPFLNLGGGTVMTYPDFLSRLGMISLWLVGSLIVWLLVFMREYWLYLHAWRHISERSLDRLGLFGLSKRKGVSH